MKFRVKNIISGKMLAMNKSTAGFHIHFLSINIVAMNKIMISLPFPPDHRKKNDNIVITVEPQNEIFEY